MLKELERFRDGEQFKPRIQALLTKFEKIGLETKGDASFYFKRLYILFEDIHSAEELYKVLYFFYYNLASWQPNPSPGSRAAIQLFDSCPIHLTPFFRLLEEKKDYEEDAEINLVGKTFFKDNEGWKIKTINDNNEQSLSSFLEKKHQLTASNAERYFGVDKMGNIFFTAARDITFIKNIPSASLTIINLDLFVWYVLTLQKFTLYKNYIRRIPIDFFEDVEVKEYKTPQQIFTKLASNFLAEEKSDSAPVSIVKEFIQSAPEYLETDFILNFAEKFIEEQREDFILSTVRQLCYKSNIARWLETLDLATADKVLDYLIKGDELIKKFDDKIVYSFSWIHAFSPKLRLTTNLQSYAQNRSYLKYKPTKPAMLPPHHLEAYEKPFIALEEDGPSYFGMDELMIGESYLLQKYKANVINQFAEEEKKEISHNKLFYLPSIITPLVRRNNHLEFECGIVLQDLIEKHKSTIFCGITYFDENYFTPFIIFHNKILCFFPRSNVDLNFSHYEKTNEKITEAFTQLFPEKECFYTGKIQSINKRTDAWAALSTVEDILKNIPNKDFFLVSQQETFFNAKYLPLSFNDYAWDKDNTGYWYYSPLVSQMSVMNLHRWIERIRTIDMVRSLSYEGKLNLNTQFSFVDLQTYTPRQLSLSVQVIVFTDKLFCQTVNAIKQISQDYPEFSLTEVVSNYVKRLELPNEEIVNKFIDKVFVRLPALAAVLDKENILYHDYFTSAFGFFLKRYEVAAIKNYFATFLADYQLIDLKQDLDQIIHIFLRESKAATRFSTLSSKDRNDILDNIVRQGQKLFPEKRIKFACELLEDHVSALLRLVLNNEMSPDLTFSEENLLSTLNNYFKQYEPIKEILAYAPKIPSDHLHLLINKVFQETFLQCSQDTLKFIENYLSNAAIESFIPIDTTKTLLPQFKEIFPYVSNNEILLREEIETKEHYLIKGFVDNIAISINDKLRNAVFTHFETKLNRLLPSSHLRTLPLDKIISIYLDEGHRSEWCEDYEFAANPELYALGQSHINEVLKGQAESYLRELYVDSYMQIKTLASEMKVAVKKGHVDIIQLIFEVARRQQVTWPRLHVKYTHATLFTNLFEEILSYEIDNCLRPFRALLAKVNQAYDALEYICHLINVNPAFNLKNILQPEFRRLNSLSTSLSTIYSLTPSWESYINRLLVTFISDLWKNIKKGYLGFNHYTPILRLTLAHLFAIEIPGKERLPAFVTPAEAIFLEEKINQKIKTLSIDSFVTVKNINLEPSIRVKTISLETDLTFYELFALVMKWHDLLVDNKKRYSQCFLKVYSLLNELHDISDKAAPLSTSWCREYIKPLWEDEIIKTNLSNDAYAHQFIQQLFLYKNVSAALCASSPTITVSHSITMPEEKYSPTLFGARTQITPSSVEGLPTLEPRALTI